MNLSSKVLCLHGSFLRKILNFIFLQGISKFIYDADPIKTGYSSAPFLTLVSHHKINPVSWGCHVDGSGRKFAQRKALMLMVSYSHGDRHIIYPDLTLR